MLREILNDLRRTLLLKRERILSLISYAGLNEPRHINVSAHFLNPKRKEVRKDEKEGIHTHRAPRRHSYHRHSCGDSLPSFQPCSRTSSEDCMSI